MPGSAQVSVTGGNLDSLGGRYQLITRLGAGGMSEVFLASARGPRSFHKLVVIKRMLASTAQIQGSARMFMDEAEITARFNHPNIVQTFEIVSDAEHLSIVMEFLEGQPLDRIFDLLEDDTVSQGVLGNRNVWVRLIADALKGLHYAHELRDYDGQPLNIVHRDISPQNLFLTYDGVVKIVDFGIAKAALSSINTEVGIIKGKLGYMAPEQAQGVSVDRRTDIFSAGVVLWEFLANRCLRLEDPLTVLQKMATEETPALSTVAPDVPRALEAIVSKATARNVEDRYATAQEMRLALEEYLAGEESTVTTADAAQAITKHFARDRQVLGERIREVISGTPPGGAGPRESMELPAVSQSHIKTTVGTPGVGTDQLLSEMHKSSRRPKVIAATVLGAVALLAVAALRLLPRESVAPGDTEETQAAATGEVTIESTPTSASVRLDGTFIGTTPLTERTRAGKHEVTVLKEGFTETSHSIEAKSGETVKLSLVLLPVASAEKPQGTTASEKDASDGRVPGHETAAPKTFGGGQAKPKQRAAQSQPKVSPVPKTRPTPTQPSIPIIDESSDAKINVDVID